MQSGLCGEEEELKNMQLGKPGVPCHSLQTREQQSLQPKEED